MELHDGIVYFAAKIVESEVVYAFVERRSEFYYRTGVLINPDIAFKLQGVVAPAQLYRSRGRSSRQWLEVNLDERPAFDCFLGDRLEGVAGLVILVQHQEHACKAIGDQQGLAWIPECRLLGLAALRQAQRAAPAARLQLVVKDRFFTVHRLIVLGDHGLRHILSADNVGSFL